MRPAAGWYVVAGAIVVVGLAGAAVVLGTGIATYTDRIDDFDRTVIPGTLEVEITDTGGYSIYHEYEDADSSTGFTPRPTVTVTDPSGDTVFLDLYGTTVTYASGGHEGEGIFTFSADEPGTYEVSADGEPGTVIAVGPGIGRGLATSILGSVALGGIALLGGVVMAIVVAVKRSQSRRQLAFPPSVGGWRPPPSPPPPAPFAPPAPPAGYGRQGRYVPPGVAGSPGPPGGYGPRAGEPVDAPPTDVPPEDAPPPDSAGG